MRRLGSGTPSESGFTLLELLVVLVIIAILAAIAIPIFFRQREKGFVAQSQSALANAKLMAEAYYTSDGGNGSYADMDLGALEDEGLRYADDQITLIVAPEADGYCIVAVHTSLSGDHAWKTASLHNLSGAPTEADSCPGSA